MMPMETRGAQPDPPVHAGAPECRLRRRVVEDRVLQPADVRNRRGCWTGAGSCGHATHVTRPTTGPPKRPVIHGYRCSCPRVDRPGRSVLGDGDEGLAGSDDLVREPRPLRPEHQAAALRENGIFQWAGTGQIVHPDEGDPGVPRPLRESLDRRMVVDVQVPVGDHRAAAVPPAASRIWTPSTLNALAVRTTEPMLKSCSQFWIATWSGCRRVSRSATIASTVQ